MRISVSTDDMTKFPDKIREYLGLAGGDRIKVAVYSGAIDVHRHAIDAISAPKSGVLVKVSRTGKPHKRSAAGEAPAVETGRLKTSLYVTASSGRAEADVVAPVSYAVHLEYGTRNMAPRPFLKPALDDNREKIKERVLRAMMRGA